MRSGVSNVVCSAAMVAIAAGFALATSCSFGSEDIEGSPFVTLRPTEPNSGIVDEREDAGRDDAGIPLRYDELVKAGIPQDAGFVRFDFSAGANEPFRVTTTGTGMLWVALLELDSHEGFMPIETNNGQNVVVVGTTATEARSYRLEVSARPLSMIRVIRSRAPVAKPPSDDSSLLRF
jgi:hypothetical protein